MSLPENICTKCNDELNVAYHFRKKCEESSIILKSIVKSAEVDAHSQEDEAMLDPSSTKIELPATNDKEEMFCTSNVDDSEYNIEPSTFDESECNAIVKTEVTDEKNLQEDAEENNDTTSYFEEQFIESGVSSNY